MLFISTLVTKNKTTTKRLKKNKKKKNSGEFEMIKNILKKIIFVYNSEVIENIYHFYFSVFLCLCGK